MDQAMLGQLACDAFQSRPYPRIVRPSEASQRDKQRAGVELPSPQRLHEGAGVEYLAVGVQLELIGRGVADADRPRVAVPVELRQLVFVQQALTAHPVDDL